MEQNGSHRKTYFVSDSHFGVPDREQSRNREETFIHWLDSISKDADAIYIMGDLFEFWFEYRTVIPKGYARLFGKLAAITDSGIPVYFFRGNHDIWAFSYLEEELNMTIYSDHIIKDIKGSRFFLAHGDGLGKGDKGYKFIRKVFRNRINQWLFRWLHPDIGSRLGYYFSNKSRANHEQRGLETTNLRGIERLTGYCKKVLEKHSDIDYFVFGHIHLPKKVKLNERSLYVSLGDWIRHFSYGVFDGTHLNIEFYQKNNNTTT